MKKYRRIEVNAYHRQVTVVSGEWRPDDFVSAQASHKDDGVSLDDSGASEPIAPESPEGQLILVEAVRTLEQRLTPETRALISLAQDNFSANGAKPNGLFLKLRSFYQSICPKVLGFARKEK